MHYNAKSLEVCPATSITCPVLGEIRPGGRKTDSLCLIKKTHTCKSGLGCAPMVTSMKSTLEVTQTQWTNVCIAPLCSVSFRYTRSHHEGVTKNTMKTKGVCLQQGPEGGGLSPHVNTADTTFNIKLLYIT